MAVVAVLGGVAALASVFGFAGALWWGFDVISNFRPQIGALGLIAGMVLLAGRWRRTGMVVSLASVVSVVMVAWLWIPASNSDVGGAGDAVRVVTFNLLSSNEEYEAVIAWLDSTDADVVFLQEASLPWEEMLRESDLGYRVEVTRDPNLIFGTLVLVREPHAEVTGFGFGRAEPRAVEVWLPLGDERSVTLLGIHPLSPTSEERALIGSAQIDWALGRLDEVRGPVVLAGDFNSSPWTYPFRQLTSAGLRDTQRGWGLQTTFPATAHQLLRVSIDHVLVSPDVHVTDRRVGPPLGSDHLPVVVDVVVG